MRIKNFNEDKIEKKKNKKNYYRSLCVVYMVKCFVKT